MNWTKEQFAEAMDHIGAIRESTAQIQLDIAETRASIIRMQEAFDRMTAQVRAQLPDIPSPSICPIATS